MHHLKRILVGLDLQTGDRLVGDELPAPSAAALRQAVELAETSGAQVTLATSLEISGHAEQLIEDARRQQSPTVVDLATGVLRGHAEEAAPRGVKASATVLFGQPWEELTREILRNKHDLLVVGTCTRGRTSQALFGSTLRQLLRVCPCPVWIVHPQELREIREIVVTTSLDDVSLRALHVAVAAAHLLSARLFVLHVLEYPMTGELRDTGTSDEEIAAYRARVRATAEESLHQQLGQTDYRTLHHGLKVEFREGDPADEIAKFVNETDADLAIMAARPKPGWQTLVLGSTLDRLLPQLRASLLAIKPADFSTPIELP